MKLYEIRYLQHDGTQRTEIAKNATEKCSIINRCEDRGDTVESVRAFDPTPVEDRFYA